jgi:hypothetical protein
MRVRMCQFVRGMDDEVAVVVLRLLEVWKLLRVGVWVKVRDVSAG